MKVFIDSDQIKSFVFTLGCDMAAHKSIQETKRIMKMVLAEVGSDLDNSELDYAAQVVTCSLADKVTPSCREWQSAWQVCWTPGLTDALSSDS